uniref:hypothetical protein n=1 Tax=Flavobacterium sp. TaxID=239 RepID=UPI0040498795
MEHHAQSVDDALIGGLSYKLKPGASYVTNRRSVSYFAQGGNQYSPNGVKVMKFNLTGNDWLDPSTFRIMFQLNNAAVQTDGSTKILEPLSWNPACFFRRARVICGGVVVEDIDDFNRLSLMITALKTEEEQNSIAAEGFCNFDDKYTASESDSRSTYRSEDFDKAGIIFTSRKAVFKPIFGLFDQDKLLPIRYCPIQIELELVNNFMDAIIKRDGNKSDLWNITDIQAKCDLLTLDNSLDNEYAAHLLSGKSLPINFATWSHTNQSTGNDKNFSANIHRALTRLKSVFVTLNSAEGVQYKNANNFFHPIAVKLNDAYDVSDEHSVQLQIGSKIIPEYPMTSVTEAMSQLRKTVGNRPLHIYGRWYRSHRDIIGLDLEKISGAGFTGMSTKAGDQLTINFKDCDATGTGYANSVPTRMLCALNYDAVLNIQSEGVQILD